MATWIPLGCELIASFRPIVLHGHGLRHNTMLDIGPAVNIIWVKTPIFGHHSILVTGCDLNVGKNCFR